nr:hypothetical protein [Rhizobium sullae]
MTANEIRARLTKQPGGAVDQVAGRRLYPRIFSGTLASGLLLVCEVSEHIAK